MLEEISPPLFVEVRVDPTDQSVSIINIRDRYCQAISRLTVARLPCVIEVEGKGKVCLKIFFDNECQLTPPFALTLK